MNEEMKQFTLRIDGNLLDKFGYIADYDGRTKNKEIIQLIKNHVTKFELENGKIDISKNK